MILEDFVNFFLRGTDSKGRVTYIPVSTSCLAVNEHEHQEDFVIQQRVGAQVERRRWDFAKQLRLIGDRECAHRIGSRLAVLVERDLAKLSEKRCVSRSQPPKRGDAPSIFRLET